MNSPTQVLERDWSPSVEHIADGGREVPLDGLQTLTQIATRSFLLALVLTTLVAAGTLIARFGFNHDNLLGASKLFDPRFEANIPTWLNTITLFSAGLVAILIGSGMRKARGRFWSQWLILGAGFVLLSIDEAAELHELTIRLLPTTFMGWNVPPHAWSLIGLSLAAIAAVYFLPFLRHLPSRTRNLFILGGATYLAGAAGFEMMQGVLLSQGTKQLSVPYMTLALLEETLEITGILIFLSAALAFLSARVLRVTWKESA